jgi:DUF1009 family protein
MNRATHPQGNGSAGRPINRSAGQRVDRSTGQQVNRPTGQPVDRSAEPVGLLAGYGRFPFVFADAARRSGLRVVCVGIRHSAAPELAERVDSFTWVGVAKLGRIIRTFRRHGVRRLVMAGKVAKAQLYTPWRAIQFVPDLRFLRWWFSPRRRDNRDDSVMLSLIDEFGRENIRVESALDYCPELLVKAGCCTRRKPTASELGDIRFGWEMAKEMGRLDVGQTVAVKERSTLAVEAIEGTDRAILRAGALCRAGGFTVVKVAKPQQDMRFDVPTVGRDTIETLHRSGARVLAIEADKTILLDELGTIALADRYGISIVALRGDELANPLARSA